MPSRPAPLALEPIESSSLTSNIIHGPLILPPELGGMMPPVTPSVFVSPSEPGSLANSVSGSLLTPSVASLSSIMPPSPAVTTPHPRSRASMLLTSGTFLVNNLTRMAPGVRLKDLGSGSGFMHPEKLFLYRGRRTYLHEDLALSKLTPPVDFMSKKQLRRLIKVDEARVNMLKSPKVSNLQWGRKNSDSLLTIGSPTEGCVPLEPEADKEQRRARAQQLALSAWSQASNAGGGGDGSPTPRRGSRPRKGRIRNKKAVHMDNANNFIAEDWTRTMQAGCVILVHKRTGELRSGNNMEDVTTFDGEVGTGALVYGKESMQAIDDLLTFLEGKTKAMKVAGSDGGGRR